MSKGPTKAQQALAEAREWIEASKEEIKEREAALVEAQGQLVMHETIYAILEKTLTRQSSAKSSSKKSTTKRAGKKSASKGTLKSSRASGMAAAINRSLSQGRQVVKDGSPCFATVDDNGGEMTCGKPEDDSVHDTRYLSSHPFVRDSRTAPRAGAKSSTNGGAVDATVNSGDETMSAGAVAGGSNG